MKNLLRVFFLKIQIYPQTSIEQKYGAFYLKNKDTLISFTSPTELKSSSPLKRPKSIFTDPLGRFSHRVAMSLCRMCV